jgi:hypothetical protein
LHRKLAGRYIDVYHYPDGRIEPRANGAALPYTIYDRLSEIDQGAIVDNKRLGAVLQIAQYVQGWKLCNAYSSSRGRLTEPSLLLEFKSAPPHDSFTLSWIQSCQASTTALRSPQS